MLESPVLQELIAEVGAKVRHADLIRILEARFGPISREVKAAIESIWDERKLADLVTLAASCESLESFTDGLQT